MARAYRQLHTGNANGTSYYVHTLLHIGRALPHPPPCLLLPVLAESRRRPYPRHAAFSFGNSSLCRGARQILDHEAPSRDHLMVKIRSRVGTGAMLPSHSISIVTPPSLPQMTMIVRPLGDMSQTDLTTNNTLPSPVL